MITKSGEKLVKSAGVGSVLLAGAEIGGGHVGQNVALRWALNNLEKSKLLNVIMRAFGKPQQGMSTIRGNALYGATTGALPELGMLYEKISNGPGKKLKNVLESQNLSIDNLPRRHQTALSLAVQGRFRDAYRVAKTPESREALNAALSEIFPNIDAVTSNMPIPRAELNGPVLAKFKNPNIEISINPEKLDEILGKLEELYKNHPLTGQIAEAFAGDKASKLIDILRGNDNLLKKSVRNGANILTRGALFPIEPGMAVLNEGKRFADWELLQKIGPLKKAQDWIGKKFVTEPLKNNFEAGLRGEETVKFKGLRAASEDIKNIEKTQGREAAKARRRAYHADAFDAYGMNAFTNMGGHMANDFGLMLHRAGVTPEQFAAMRQNADRLHNLYKEQQAARNHANLMAIETKGKQFMKNNYNNNNNNQLQNAGKSQLEKNLLSYRDYAQGANILSAIG